MKYLVTGSCGFIGFHLTKKLLEQGIEVVGIDNLTDYYDVKLKNDRLLLLKENKNFTFYKVDIAEIAELEKVFKKEKIDKVCNLAAQAGVRYSIENPFIYEKTNVLGFLNILEMLKKYEIKDLVFASSSSVYGGIEKLPFSEEMKIDKPVSLYAATKATNELFASVYHSLYKINAIGLRFFTVYGPWGRPDMSYFLFADSIINNKPIKIFNFGKMKRDFTYVDDIVMGINKALERTEKIGYGIYNLGNSKSVNLLDFVSTLENKMGKKAVKEMMPLQKGDVVNTYADIKKAEKDLDFKPKTNIDEGLGKFVLWYKNYYQV